MEGERYKGMEQRSKVKGQRSKVKGQRSKNYLAPRLSVSTLPTLSPPIALCRSLLSAPSSSSLPLSPSLLSPSLSRPASLRP
eukprot:1969910-Rhodomonas_salina.1